MKSPRNDRSFFFNSLRGNGGIRLLGCLAVALFIGAPASAAEIKVLSSNGVTAVLTKLGAEFEKNTGHKLDIRFDTANVLKGEIDKGESFDVVILTASLIAGEVKDARVFSDSVADVARSGIGLAVKKGAPRPDISSLETFKQAMLNAKSVAFTATGTSGIYFAGVLDRLGIGEHMKAKSVRPQGGAVAELVARGEAEMGVQQISELLVVPGADYVGPLPAEIQNFTTFTAAVGSKAKDAAAARALIAYLARGDAATTIKAAGMELPSR